MKKVLFAALAVLSIAGSFAACKTNTNDLPENTVTQNSAARLPRNGEVTDRNGIIGDSDDLVMDRDGRVYNDRTDNPVGNAVRNAGDIVNNAAHNAGDVVNNIADKAGDTVKNATDRIGDTTENRSSR